MIRTELFTNFFPLAQLHELGIRIDGQNPFATVPYGVRGALELGDVQFCGPSHV